MKFLGIDIDIKNVPSLDEGFIPLGLFNRAFLKTATKPVKIAVERNSGYVSVYETKIHGTEEMKDADNFFIERYVKFVLWAIGGYKVYICGDKNVYEFIKKEYAKDGKRAFDNGLWQEFTKPNLKLFIKNLMNALKKKVRLNPLAEALKAAV